MMVVLIGIALKSLIVSILTFVALQLMKRRSAAERSWVAHIGLLALIIMAFAPLVLPKVTLETPALSSHASTPRPSAPPPYRTLSGVTPVNVTPGPQPGSAQTKSPLPTLDAATAATALYAVPAAILLILTFLALLRLIALRARADVLVDGHWLSALARAQRRMGFKHGTALLTSNELASPISWGLMRPVILLNNRAVAAAEDAEAIIAHELAHVARMDWLKLLLARFATALFWFNPLVWQLAREAHQLREEAADDSVLAADIVDTDYAQLLVGVARHECPGLLLGAHGVAPSRNSLARRVARVLDGKSVRGPVARSFALCALAGAVLVAAPLAALTVEPASTGFAKPASTALGVPARAALSHSDAADLPADLPHLIAKGVSTSVSTATAAIVTQVGSQPKLRVTAPNGASVESSGGTTIARASDGSTVTVYPPDARGRRQVVAVAASGATAVSYADASDDMDGDHVGVRHKQHETAIEAAMELKALGVTPEYMAALRAASPSLRDASIHEIMELRAVGVTPDYVREIVSAGFANLRAAQIEEARALGMSPDYMREVRATGVPVTFDELIELRAMGIRPDELARLRTAGPLTIEKIHRMRTSRPPQPPQPPGQDWHGPDGS